MTGSRVIFFSSTTAHMSSVTPNYVVYTATKGAIEQFTRILAKDLGTRGVTVNCVAPGPVDTELFRAGKSPETIATFENLHPAKRLGEPDDIAPVVAFLAREDSRWVNGQTILVNGVSSRSSIYISAELDIFASRAFLSRRAIRQGWGMCVACFPLSQRFDMQRTLSGTTTMNVEEQMLDDCQIIHVHVPILRQSKCLRSQRP